MRDGLLGAIFAVIVIWVFLRSWRSTVIAGLSIPLSVIGALIILWSRGESLNMLTLGGLTIAIGRVIDDSIVVIENTHRHLQEGDSVRRAAYTGTREVAGAITASTLTTVAVFLPLGMVAGLASEFFRPFALTVTFALLCSLAVALIVVPVASTWLLSKRQVGHRDQKELTTLQNAYLPALRFALDHKALTLIAAAAIFVGTMLFTPLLKTNLFDSSGQPTMSITQTMDPGTSLDATMAAASKVEEVLKTTEGVEIYQVTGGSTGSLFGAGGGTNASSSQATFAVTTDPDADKNAIMDEVRAGVAELRNAGTISVTGDDSSSGMGGMSLMEVRISASDPQVLREANDILLAQVKTVDGLADVNSNLSEGRPSATIVVDQEKAAAAGVTPATLSQYITLVLNGYPLGTVPTTAGTLPAQLMVGEIVVPPLPGAVSQVLTRLPVAGTSGMVPLGDIAKVVEVRAPVQVTHVDGARTASITATAVNNNIGAASTAVEDALKDVRLPEGATWELAGATEATNDVFRTLGIAMLVAILLVYIIMVATFRSLLNPLILLVSIPFAAVGAVLALVVTGTSLGMPSLVGLLMLIGIVVTNAIVLLDLVEQFRRRGMDARTAVIEGGRRRLRPILMTAVATILALIPMALGDRRRGRLPLDPARRGRDRRPLHLDVPHADPRAGVVPGVRPAAARRRLCCGRRGLHRTGRGAGAGRVTGVRPPASSGRRAAPLRCGIPLTPAVAAKHDAIARQVPREESTSGEAGPEEEHQTGREQDRCREKPRTAADMERPTPRELTRAELIDELNNDLAKEFQALVQYVQHAAAMTGPQYDAIKAELVVHSNEEHAHAISLADQIDFLGGVPGVDVAQALDLPGLEGDARAGPRRRARRHRPLPRAHRPGRDAPGVRPAPRARGHPHRRGGARARPAGRARPLRPERRRPGRGRYAVARASAAFAVLRRPQPGASARNDAAPARPTTSSATNACCPPTLSIAHPPNAGPRAAPPFHTTVHTPMYRPRTASGARSATSAEATGDSSVSPRLRMMMRTTRDPTGPANAVPPTPTASSALEIARRIMRFRRRTAFTSGIWTATTMSALSVSRYAQVLLGTPRKSVMYTA